MGYCFYPISFRCSSTYISQLNRLHSYSSHLILPSWSFVSWYGRSCTFFAKRKTHDFVTVSGINFWRGFIFHKDLSGQMLLFLWTWDLAPSYKRVKRHWNNGIRPSTSHRVGYVKKAKVYIKFISGWDKWISLLPHRSPFGDELGCFDQFLMVKVPILTLKCKTKQTNTF